MKQDDNSLAYDENNQYSGFSVLPEGIYKVIIADTEIKTPKSGNGEMLYLEYEILDDDKNEGKKIRDWIVYKHPKADAERIGKQKLNTIRFLTGTGNTITSTDHFPRLNGKTLSLLLTIDKNDKGKDINSIKKYLPFESEETETSQETEGKPSFIKK